MKRLTSIAVLLTIAAALATTVISCTSDDNLTEQPAEPAVEQSATAETRTVHVTVGAGFADGSGDGTTRSAVMTDLGSTTRTLTFTTGDRLFVRGEIKYASPQKIIAGYLTVDGTIVGGATTATFSGDLTVYVSTYDQEKGKYVYIESSHTFTTDDPLSECDAANGILVHKDAVGFYVDEDDIYGNYTPAIAPTVDELMTQSLPVDGSYDSSSKQFTLGVYNSTNYCTSIFNCNVSGLKPNTTYKVGHAYKANFEKVVDEHGQELGTVTTDAGGKAVFAAYNICEKAEKYHALNFISADKSDDRTVYLGTRALQSKVYNIGTVASPREALKYQEAKFSVGADKQVYFSTGNLYAWLNDKSEWEWHFQPHQWMYVGNSEGNKLISGTMKISSSFQKVDLFGWNGASAPDKGTTGYVVDNYGINNSTDNADYGTTVEESLKHDWGHNVINNYPADTWRTPTGGEWEYLLNERTVTNSLSDGARYTMATIGGKYKGLILFPDNYVHPAGTGYTTGTYNAASDYTTAVTFEFWVQMENAGCVFLPAAGYRPGTVVYDVSTFGYYWSSSWYAGWNQSANAFTTPQAYHLRFDKVSVIFAGYNRCYGHSVRLVRDV